MQAVNPANTDILRGRVDTIILNVLLEKDRYGYEILSLISDKSEGRYTIKQPTLYSCLKRLEKQGFISSYFGDESQGGRRRYYTLTEKGHNTLSQDQKEWEFSRTILDKLLSDKEVDLKTVDPPFDPNELRPLTKRVKAYEPSVKAQPIVIPITFEATMKSEENIKISSENSNKPTNSEENKNDKFVNISDFLNPHSENKTENQNKKEMADTQQEIEKGEKSQILPSTSTKNKQDKLFGITKEEEYRLKEQRKAAERLLYLDGFIEPNTPPYFESKESTVSDTIKLQNEKYRNDLEKKSPLFSERALSKPDINEETSKAASDKVYEEQSINYREALGAIFSKGNPSAGLDSNEQEALQIDATPTKTKHFYDLKQSLMDEGYKLRTYSKSNSSNYYYMNYVYSNRLVRDCSLLVYMVILIELLVILLLKNFFNYSNVALIIIGAVSLLIPITATFIWSLNPTKRVKARFNFPSMLINALIIFILISAVATVISLLSPSDFGFSNGQIFVPYILAFNFPIFAVIYGILYNSKNYHLKN